MKRNLRKLQLINLLIVGIENFYTVNVWDDEIRLQGTYNSTLVKDLSKLFTFEVNSNGYLQANKKGIRIVLTSS